MPRSGLLLAEGGVSTADQDGAGETSLRFGNNIYDSVALTLRNTIKGDPDGSIRSLLAPDTLSPAQHKSLTSEWLGTERGPIATVLSTVTNPLVLIGAALSYKWPAMNLAEMGGVAKSLKRYERWIPAGLRSLLGVEEIFQGTPIPRLMSSVSRESVQFLDRHLPKLADALQEWRGVAGRTETTVDNIRWAFLLDDFPGSKKAFSVLNDRIKRVNQWRAESNLPALGRLSPEQFRVAPQAGDEIITNAMQDMTEGMWNDLVSTKGDMKGMTTWLSDRGVSAGNLASKIEGGYFPHVAKFGEDKVNRLKQAMVERVLSDPQFARMSPQQVWNRISEGAGRAGLMAKAVTKERTGVMPPSYRDLQMLGPAIDDGAIQSLKGLSEYNLALPEPKPAYYSMQLIPSVLHYGRSVARGYAWTLKGLGPALINEVNNLATAERLTGNMAKTELMKSLYLPIAMDIPTFQQGMKAMEWGGVRQWAWRMVDHPAVTKWLSSDMHDALRNFVASDSDVWSWKGAGQKLAGMFYLSTLGFNVSAATQNMLQPLITTAPVLGIVPTMRGFARVVEKMPQYASMRLSGTTEHEALSKLFPEFMSRNLDIRPLYEEVLGESSRMSRSGLFGRNSALKKPIELAKQSMMGLFGESERFVRLVAAESGLGAAREAGLTGPAVLDAMEEVVNTTQLWAGQALMPSGLANWSAPAKQLLTFPGKMAGMAFASAFDLGGAFTPGTLGRGMMYSAAAYEGVRGMTGADISSSLFFGALPGPEDRGPFAPIPFVPPTFSVLGGAALDFAKGDMEFAQTRKNIPLMIPGGLQLMRILQQTSPKLASAFGRTYSDFSRPGPDGSIPTFNAEGQLIGYERPFDLVMKTLGLPGKLLSQNSAVSEQEAFKYIMAQRDRMRAMKRDFLMNYAEGDTNAAMQINSEHTELYGYPVPVRPQDWQAVQTNLMLPRIERMVNTIPKPERSRMGLLVSAALAGNAERFLGFDPELLGVVSARERLRASSANPQYIPTGGPQDDYQEPLQPF